VLLPLFSQCFLSLSVSIAHIDDFLQYSLLQYFTLPAVYQGVNTQSSVAGWRTAYSFHLMTCVLVE
jgi:hypothetical protein